MRRRRWEREVTRLHREVTALSPQPPLLETPDCAAAPRAVRAAYRALAERFAELREADPEAYSAYNPRSGKGNFRSVRAARTTPAGDAETCSDLDAASADWNVIVASLTKTFIPLSPKRR